MLAFDFGGKCAFTQSCPTASPNAWSVAAVHSFQRGVGSACPLSVLSKKAKSSSRNALGRSPAEPWITCHRRYDYHVSTGCELINSFNPLKKSGVATLRLSNGLT